MILSTLDNGLWHLIKTEDELGHRCFRLRHINGTISREFTSTDAAFDYGEREFGIYEDANFNAPIF